jgi:sporulation protein YlmC with PRC-barrel domain
MQHLINNLVGYTMGATDGEIGGVDAFYFDDETWAVRYMEVQAGSWFSGRRVLISPVALVKGGWKQGVFDVNLTKEQIRTSPEIDTDKPVYRQHEMQLYNHYRWQDYWSGSGYYGGGMWAMPQLTPVNDATDVIPPKEGDPHLRSSTQINGYHIHTVDGVKAGHVADFIMDDESWQIVYLVVDSDKLFGGKKIKLAVSHIKKVEWDNSAIFVDVSAVFIDDAATFEDAEFLHHEKALMAEHVS